MAKKRQNNGISPAGKIAILCAAFGLPASFAFSSWGLAKVYEIAPLMLGVVLIVVCTAYTAYTAGLMYKFYDLSSPVLRIVPCICELTLIDLKYHTPCYILYILAILFGLCSQLPYSVLGILGQGFATSAPIYFLVAMLICLLVIQAIKGVGFVGCMKDIEAEWRKQTHADVGVFSKFSVMSFIPFVRVLAMYAINKPLSTMVTFMGTTVEDGEEDAGFVAEDAE